MKLINSLVFIEDLSVSDALAGVPPGEEFPQPIPMPQDTWGLLPKLEQPFCHLTLPSPSPSPHQKALGVMGPSCAAQVIRTEEQAVGASEISNPHGGDIAAEGISLGWHKKSIFHVSGARPKLPGVILTSIHSRTIPKKVSYLPPQTDT